MCTTDGPNRSPTDQRDCSTRRLNQLYAFGNQIVNGNRDRLAGRGSMSAPGLDVSGKAASIAETRAARAGWAIRVWQGNQACRHGYPVMVCPVASTGAGNGVFSLTKWGGACLVNRWSAGFQRIGNLPDSAQVSQRTRQMTGPPIDKRKSDSVHRFSPLGQPTVRTICARTIPSRPIADMADPKEQVCHDVGWSPVAVGSVTIPSGAAMFITRSLPAHGGPQRGGCPGEMVATP